MNERVLLYVVAGYVLGFFMFCTVNYLSLLARGSYILQSLVFLVASLCCTVYCIYCIVKMLKSESPRAKAEYIAGLIVGSGFVLSGFFAISSGNIILLSLAVALLLFSLLFPVLAATQERIQLRRRSA